MDAVLLAAGLGTRLGEITSHTPKPLIPVGGIPMLERVARRLIAAGADRLVINTHHLADQVVEFVRSRDGFGVEAVFSHEPDAPLETGGALWKAAPLLRRDAPFFLHNTDILTDLPLRAMYEAQRAEAPLATLAVMERETSRYLLFDEIGLVGRVDLRKELRILAREPRGTVARRAFAGVHVIDPRLLERLTEAGAFSILDPYLRLAAVGEVIRPFAVDGCRWIDIGKPEQLAEAERTAERTLP